MAMTGKDFNRPAPLKDGPQAACAPIGLTMAACSGRSALRVQCTALLQGVGLSSRQTSDTG